MSTSNNSSTLTTGKALAIARVFWIMTMLFLFVMFGVVHFQFASIATSVENSPFTQEMALGVALFFGVVSVIIPKIVLNAFKAQPLGILVSNAIGIALAEAVMIIGVMYSVVTGNIPILQYFLGGSVVFMALAYPK